MKVHVENGYLWWATKRTNECKDNKCNQCNNRHDKLEFMVTFLHLFFYPDSSCLFFQFPWLFFKIIYFETIKNSYRLIDGSGPCELSIFLRMSKIISCNLTWFRAHSLSLSRNSICSWVKISCSPLDGLVPLVSSGIRIRSSDCISVFSSFS